jgi:hypothetical protein
MKTIIVLFITCISVVAKAQDTSVQLKNQRKHAVKVDLFSLVFGHVSVSYEKLIKPGRSFEVGLGLIGRGFNRDEKASGLFIKMGYKFNCPAALNTRNPHSMDGVYARPELSFGSYKQQLGTVSEHISHSISYATAGLNLGLQEVFGKIIVLDAYAGINYGLIDARQYNQREPNSSREAKDVVVYHGLLGTTSSHVFISGGFRVGFLLP